MRVPTSWVAGLSLYSCIRTSLCPFGYFLLWPRIDLERSGAMQSTWAYAKHMVFCGFCKCSKYGTRWGRMIQRETRCCCSWSRSVWRSTGERWSVPVMPVHSCIKILLIPKLNWQHFSLPLEILQFHELVSRTCLLHPKLHTYAIMSIPGKTHRINKPQSFG